MQWLTAKQSQMNGMQCGDAYLPGNRKEKPEKW